MSLLKLSFLFHDFRVVDIVEWKMTLVWHPQVTYQVEGQAHRCLQVTLRPASQDVSSLIISTLI